MLNFEVVHDSISFVQCASIAGSKTAPEHDSTTTTHNSWYSVTLESQTVTTM